jgi:hypothetical protein
VAKQCGVERCVGTLVNMRKPFLQLGKGFVDCKEVDKEESQLCVVDRLVLQLVSIVFGNADNTNLSDKLVNPVLVPLHCPSKENETWNSSRTPHTPV